MKKLFKENSSFAMVLVMILCSLFGVGGVMTANAVPIPGGGNVETGVGTSLSEIAERSENLTLDEIDEMVLMVKPYSVELDTLSRHSTVKTVTAPKYRHYTLDVLDLTTTVKTAYAGGDAQTEIITNSDDIFSKDETIIVDGVTGWDEDGVTATEEPLVLFVMGKGTTGKPIVRAVNGHNITGVANSIPAIPANAKLTRGAVAGSETQIKTDPFSAVPTDWTQYIQKHLCQVERSEMFELAPKEVKWTFSEEAEAAVFDMKRKMNVSYWRGVKMIKKWASLDGSIKAEDRYFSKGIWFQAGKEFDFNGVAPDNSNIPSFLRHVLTGNNSSKEKFFIAGSGMIEAFEKSDYFTRHIQENGVANEKDLWGLQFNGLKSKFGKLWIIHTESFDEMGWADNGFVIDFEYLIKLTYGLKTNNYDMRTLMISAATARIIEEQTALVLKNPKAHCRVYLNK